MTYFFTPTRMWSVGGDVCVGTGPLMSSWWTCHLVPSSLWERRLYCLVKWNMHIPFDLTKVNTHVYIPGKNVQFLQETRLRMFITILVVIGKKNKNKLETNLRVPEQNNKTQLWHVHTKDYTAVENEETTAASSNMDIS